MIKLNSKHFRIGILIILLVLIGIYGFTKLANQTNAYAVGELTIDWGVFSGPIFTLSNLAPGQSESKSVKVTNNSPLTRQVAIKGIKQPGVGNLEEALLIEISNNGTDLYGGATGTKTLSQFFADSQLEGILLRNLLSGQESTFLIKIILDPQSSNDFQGLSLIMDLHIGISVDTPASCQNIEFNSQPIFGTVGNNNLVGTSGNDLIFGLEGNDRIDGRGGDDCIVSGPGNDQVKGGSGDDSISGSAGNDNLDGGSGQDQINGDEGNDTLSGGSEDDNIFGGLGNDQLFGGSSNDTLVGGDGNDNLHGNSGNDSCDGEVTNSCEW